MNFTPPEVFVDYADLDSFLHKDGTGAAEEEEKSKKVVEALHKILRPFSLRRVKSNAEKNLFSSMWCHSVSNQLARELLTFMFYRKGDQYLRRADGNCTVLEKDIDVANGRSLFTISTKPTHFWQISLARKRARYAS